MQLSTAKLQELKRQLEMILAQGLILSSSSPYGVPIFFVKKKEGDLRMVCGYRELNKITIGDFYPLPLIEETVDLSSGAIIFSKVELIGA